MQLIAPVKGLRVSVGQRLKEEREVKGLSQTQFAEACGATKRMQIYFEADNNMPGGSYLVAAADLGVDVQYVLTGRRGIERVHVPIDESLLSACIEGVEEGLRQTKLRMAAPTRAALVVELYRHFAGKAKPSRATILEFVQKAA